MVVNYREYTLFWCNISVWKFSIIIGGISYLLFGKLYFIVFPFEGPVLVTKQIHLSRYFRLI